MRPERTPPQPSVRNRAAYSDCPQNEVFHEAGVYCSSPRHGHGVTPQVAQCICRRKNEGARVAPQIRISNRSPCRNARATNGNAFHGIIAGTRREIGKVFCAPEKRSCTEKMVSSRPDSGIPSLRSRNSDPPGMENRVHFSYAFIAFASYFAT